MRRIGAWALVFLMILGLCACGDDGTGKGFRLPLDGEPRQLDPQAATDTASVTVIAALFEGLTRINADGEVVDGAATHTLSADRCTYTFTLKESYWSTLSIRGEETPWDEPTRVVADDFLFGIQRAVTPENQSGTATALSSIKNAVAIHKGEQPLSALGVQVLNDRTLTITLAQPDDTFLSKLAATPFMPCNRAFFRYTAGRYGLEKKYVLSNGAFSLTAWNHNDSLLLNKNENYHTAAQITPSAVRYVQNTTDAAAALQAGALDVAFLSSDKIQAAQDAGIQLLTLNDSVRQLSLNTISTPLTNTHIRCALTNAIEWKTVYEYLQSKGEDPANGYIPPDATHKGKPYRNESNSFTYTTNVTKATEALGKGLAALYPQDTSPTLPPLTLIAPADDTSANLARYLVQSWQKNLKLYVALELMDESALQARIQSGNYQLALHTVVGGGLTAADNLTAYATGASNNITGFSNDLFNGFYAAAQHGESTAFKAECVLHEQCPAIPLSFPRRYYGIAANTAAITVRPFDGGTYGSAYEFLNAKKFED